MQALKKSNLALKKIHSIILCAHEPQPTGIIGWCILFMYVMYVSPGVESNQNNVTCFDLIRSHQTHLLVKTLESNDWSHWMDSRVSSTQTTVRLWRNWRFQKLVRKLRKHIRYIRMESMVKLNIINVTPRLNLHTSIYFCAT